MHKEISLQASPAEQTNFFTPLPQEVSWGSWICSCIKDTVNCLINTISGIFSSLFYCSSSQAEPPSLNGRVSVEPSSNTSPSQDTETPQERELKQLRDVYATTLIPNLSEPHSLSQISDFTTLSLEELTKLFNNSAFVDDLKNCKCLPCFKMTGDQFEAIENQLQLLFPLDEIDELKQRIAYFKRTSLSDPQLPTLQRHVINTAEGTRYQVREPRVTKEACKAYEKCQNPYRENKKTLEKYGFPTLLNFCLLLKELENASITSNVDLLKKDTKEVMLSLLLNPSEKSAFDLPEDAIKEIDQYRAQITRIELGRRTAISNVRSQIHADRRTLDISVKMADIQSFMDGNQLELLDTNQLGSNHTFISLQPILLKAQQRQPRNQNLELALQQHILDKWTPALSDYGTGVSFLLEKLQKLNKVPDLHPAFKDFISTTITTLEKLSELKGKIESHLHRLI